ncbi:MAG: hypothetical protein KGJ11_07955, partial [Candidatus Omnitrophica bacterium]|nr:hypothetical protein [Candidatus Omnitrophota bacterium]
NIRQDGATLDSHTMLTIAAMLDNAGKFKDATVVDIGAGYGLLSQIALSLGAKKVNLFENVEAFNAIAVAGLHAAGWMPDKFAVYNADMTNDRHLQDAANIVGKDAENVIVLDNTGMTYGDLNDKSLRLAKEFKHLKLIINAGHYAGAPSVLGRFYEQNQKVMQSAEQIFHQNGWQYQRADYFPHGPNEVGVAAYVVQPDKAMNAQDNIKKALDLSGPTDKKDADVLHLLDKLDIEEGDPLLMIGPGKMVAHVLFSALQKAKVEVMEAPLFPDNSGYAAAIDRAKAMDPAIARNILTRRMSANIQASKYDCVVMINLDGIPEEQTKQITQLALKAVKSEKFLIVGAAQAGMIEKLDGSFKKIGKKEDVVLLQHTIPIQNKIAARLDWEFITTAQLESYIHAFKSGNFPQDEMTLYKRIDHEISVAGLDGEERIKMPEEKYLSILEESLQIMKSSSIWSPHQSNAAMASRPAVLAVPLPLENQKPLNIPLEVGEKKLITIIKKRSKTELVLERKGPSAFYLNGRLLSGRMTISKNHDIKVDIFVAGQKLEIVNLLNEPPFLFQARHFPLEAYGTVRILTSGTDPKDNTVLDFFVDRQENDRLLLYGDGIEASSAPSITVHKGQTKLMIRSAEDGLWIENLTRGSDLYIEIDQAMAAKTSKSADLKGGIDFNPTSLNMQVRKQGKGFRFKFNGRVVDAAGITGAVFDIRTMTPVSGLSKLLEATTS